MATTPKVEISRAKRDNSFAEVIYSDGTMATISNKTGKQAGGLLNISNQAKFKDAKAAYDKANATPQAQPTPATNPAGPITTPVPAGTTPTTPVGTGGGFPPPPNNTPINTSSPPTTGGNIPPTTQPNPTPVAPTPNNNVQVTPDVATGADEINAVDISGQLVTDPALLVNKNAGTQLSGATPAINPNTGVQGAAPTGTPDAFNKTATDATATTGTAVNAGTTQAVASQGDSAAQGQTNTVEAAKTFDQVVQDQMEGANGTVSQNAQVDANGLQIDVDATGKGLNETGKALNDSAQQSISTLIDTSTAAGKLLAQQLGEGNYTDTKTTVKGQLDMLAAEFVDPLTGQPKIPSWASGVARNVSRIAAFKGMTGTAATAAMSQALLEASLPIATEDAKFFQTINMSNLDKKQEAIINKANVLAKLDIANLDARTTAAVTNAKSFLEMDLANLSNDQQAELVNTQQRFQSILEDAKSENTARLFNAQSQNEMDMYYDQLADAMEQFNVSQKNAMAEFNASELNETAKFNAQSQNDMTQFNVAEKNKVSALNATEDNAMAKFNAELEDSRERFYKEMQFQVDTANAKWRQTVTLTENAQAFEAAATDVKNRVGVSVEQLNRLWDRADSLLDYSWKAGQNDKDRKTQLALVSLKGQLDSEAADKEGWGSILGTILGAVVGWIF